MENLFYTDLSEDTDFEACFFPLQVDEFWYPSPFIKIHL